jgi:predicted metal-dependent phosphoesterase TrpH
MEKSGDGALGRPHIAAVLVEKGLVPTRIAAFDLYIADGGPAYVPKYKMSPPEAIKYIRMAGGLAFMAHPGIFLENAEGFNELLGVGFDGVEVYHPKHNSKMAVALKTIAEENDLLVSGGSDYHGFTGRDLPLGGLDISYDVLANIKARLNT